MIFIDVYEAILRRRSIRRFKQNPLDQELLEQCVDAARLAPTAANRQRLQYITVTREPGLSKVFSALAWAAYLTPKWSPSEKERPTAYIVMLSDGNLDGFLGCDAGAAVENIALTAQAEGVGTCILGSVKHSLVKKALAIPDDLDPVLVVALGYPAEEATAVDFTGSIKYWRDGTGVHRVPKKNLDMILHREIY